MQTNDQSSAQSLYWTLILGFISIIFIVDLSLPRGLILSELYFIPLYASIFMIEDKKATAILSLICIILIFAGAFFSDQAAKLWKEVFNCSIAVLTVLFGAAISYQEKKLIKKTIEAKERLQSSNEAMLILVKNLNRSNQDLDDFAYIASHDLKEPLRGLSNNAKFLSEDYEDKLDDGGKNRLLRIQFLCRRMESLVNDLLYFSRLGRQDMAYQLTELNTLVNKVAALFEPSEADIRIISPLPTVLCDQIRMTEVFRNLIANAIKYNNSKTKVVEIGYLNSYQAPHGKEKDVFFVRDNGIGFEKIFYEEIFRIFKRLNDEDETKKGTGAGLTFVRKIIERHNGKIWPESTPEKGSTFFFTLKKGTDHAAKK